MSIGRISLDELDIVELEVDPEVTGVDAPVHSIGISRLGKGLYYKISESPTGWVNIGETLMTMADFQSKLKDSFGRLRVSDTHGIFDCIFLEDQFNNLITSSNVSGATSTFNSTESSVVLNVTSTTNSKSIVQTRRYIPYHPGKSQLVKLAGNFRGIATNVEKYFGQFDADNGTYFCIKNDVINVALRSKISGVVTEELITQANWNVDKLDGTGKSGITLDVSKQQIYVIDYQLQGSGQIRYGVSIDGEIIYCHIIKNANNKATAYSQRAHLPIRAEIINKGTTASSMHMTCLVVESEGGWGPEGNLRSANNGSSGRIFGPSNTRIPLLSIRKKSAAYMTSVQILDAGVFGQTTDDFLVEVVLNGTLTGANWTNVSSYCEQDKAATSISGGSVLYSFYLRGSTSAASTQFLDVFSKVPNFFLGSDLSNNSDIISIVATNITSNATAFAFTNFMELA